MLMTLFLLTRTRPFQRLFQKRDHTPAELLLVAAIFGLFAVFSTYTGIPVEGALIQRADHRHHLGRHTVWPLVGIPAGVIRACTATSSTWMVTPLSLASSPASSPVCWRPGCT